MAKVCQALTHTESSERIEVSRALSYQSSAGVSFTVAKAVPRP